MIYWLILEQIALKLSSIVCLQKTLSLKFNRLEVVRVLLSNN
jgi:hypothetical protein